MVLEIQAGVHVTLKLALWYSAYKSSFCLFSNGDIIIAHVSPGCHQGHNCTGSRRGGGVIFKMHNHILKKLLYPVLVTTYVNILKS